MKKALWVTNYLHLHRPRSIRTRALIQHLSGELEIHVLSLDAIEDGYTDPPYQGHRVKGSKVGHWYWRLLGTPWNSLSLKEKVYHFVPKIARKAMSWFVFPGPMAFHLRQYKNQLNALLQEGDFETVILSIVPFNNYALAAMVRETAPRANVILDIGDPLVGNSLSSHTSPSPIGRMMRLEGSALSIADSIVVTNHETKKHFLNIYKNMIDARAIHVIQNGTTAPPATTHNVVTFDHNRSILKLVYAGVFYSKFREPYGLFEAVKSFGGKNVELSIYGPPSNFTSREEIDGKSIMYKGLIPYEEVPLAYQQADVTVFIDNAFGVQTPGKVFELIAAQKPLLFIYENEESATLALIRDYSGIVKCKNDSVSIRNGITSIIEAGASNKCQFNIEPFLWESRSAEFKALILKEPPRLCRGTRGV